MKRIVQSNFNGDHINVKIILFIMAYIFILYKFINITTLLRYIYIVTIDNVKRLLKQ